MTIKKLNKVARTPQPGGAAGQGAGAEGATGGATIADRFKLDTSDAKRSSAGTVSRKAAMAALIAGVLALVISAVLTIVLYQHSEFLMPM